MRWARQSNAYAGSWLALCLCAAASLAQTTPSGPGRKDAPPAAAFDRLAELFAPPGTPPIKGKRWVTIDTGPANIPQARTGWLVEDGAKEVTLLDEDSEVVKLRKPAVGEKRPTVEGDKEGNISLSRYLEADRSVAWKVEPADFAARAKKFLADGIPTYKEDRGFRDMSRGRFTLQGHVIDSARLAHFANQQGQAELAARLYAHTEQAYKKYTDSYGGGFEKTGALHEFVADRLASREQNGAISAAHGGTARAELQKRWERVAAIPYHQYRDEALEMVKGYQSLLDEDRRWVEPDAKARAAMTADQRAAYWMYHLRDLAVGQWSDPGSCSVLGEFGFGDDPKPNAAVELKNLGMAAVPHLIAHLDDTRPTRCKGHWRSYWPDGQYLLKYGDCCQQIFEAITGHTLTSEQYPMRAGKGKDCKAAAEKWWRDYQTKGERQVLIEGTAAGTRDSPRHAARLSEKYPDAALDPIVQGARASKDGWTRAALVSATEKLSGEKVLAFLRDEATGPHAESRIRASAALCDRGDPAGTKGLMRELQRLSSEGDAERPDGYFVVDELIGALARSGDPAAIRALAEGMPKHTLDTRSAMIRRLAEVHKDFRGKPLTREATDAVEDVLAQALADREEENSASSRGDKSVHDPMLGDLAAEALATRLGQPKLFDITAPFQVRERQRAEVKNVWLKRRGREPLPVAAPRTITAAPDAKVRPLVEAVRETKAAADRRSALSGLEELGLPALPAVRKLADTLAADHPARGDVQALATRLALTVAEVRFGEDSAKPTDAVRRLVEALRGRPITEEAFLGLLRELSGALPEGVRGVKLTLERIGDDTGALLVVTLIPDQPARPGLSPQLQYGSRVVVGETNYGGGFSAAAGIGRKHLRLADIDWGEFTKNLPKALKAGPGEYALVQVHCAEAR